MVSTTRIPDPNRKELRIFGLTMAGAIGGFFGLLVPWLFDRVWPVWPWFVATPFLLLGCHCSRLAAAGIQSLDANWNAYWAHDNAGYSWLVFLPGYYANRSGTAYNQQERNVSPYRPLSRDV